MRTAVSLKALPAIIVLAVLRLPAIRAHRGARPPPGPRPGSLQLLATCLVIAGIALSYDVIFGRTGLLSFGHALFVAAGSYLLTISLSDWALPTPRGRPCVAGRHDAARARRRRHRIAGRWHRLRHGDLGLRPGGVDHRDAKRWRLDRR